tara:strand:+ start:155 stop:652 length:498 start_codon:yes stop_codon:yes gene_type:complete
MLCHLRYLIPEIFPKFDRSTSQAFLSTMALLDQAMRVPSLLKRVHSGGGEGHEQGELVEIMFPISKPGGHQKTVSCLRAKYLLVVVDPACKSHRGTDFVKLFQDSACSHAYIDSNSAAIRLSASPQSPLSYLLKGDSVTFVYKVSLFRCSLKKQSGALCSLLISI